MNGEDNRLEILRYASEIYRAFNSTDANIEAAFEAGELQILRNGPVPGFTPIFSINENTHVAISSQLKYKYLEYKSNLDTIIAEVGAGRNSLAHVLAAMRSESGKNALSDRKVQSMGHQRVWDTDVVFRPYLGQAMPVERDLCIPFHHFVLTQKILEHLTEDINVVFEIGCGPGDVLAEVARAAPYKETEFVGGEIANWGLKCIEALSELIPDKNMRGIDFDIHRPDFSAISGKRAMVFSQFALAYVKPFPREFMKALFSAASDVKFLMFEPIGYSLTDKFSKHTPLFSEERADAYGLNKDLWAMCCDLSDQGIASIDHVIPDYIGKTLFSAVSLVIMSKAR